MVPGFRYTLSLPSLSCPCTSYDDGVWTETLQFVFLGSLGSSPFLSYVIRRYPSLFCLRNHAFQLPPALMSKTPRGAPPGRDGAEPGVGRGAAAVGAVAGAGVAAGAGVDGSPQEIISTLNSAEQISDTRRPCADISTPVLVCGRSSRRVDAAEAVLIRFDAGIFVVGPSVPSRLEVSLAVASLGRPTAAGPQPVVGLSDVHGSVQA